MTGAMMGLEPTKLYGIYSHGQNHPARCARRGFSLVELLVVIGIIGVLLGILLPTLAGVRRAARRTVCAARVGELVAASHLFLDVHRRFPTPAYMAPVGVTMPASIQPGLLNEMAGVLQLPSVDGSDTVDDLPDHFICPERQEVELFQDPDISFGYAFWQTGYMYLGGLDVKPNGGTILRPRAHASIQGNRRGVLWADTLTTSTVAGHVLGHGFYHYRGGVQFDPVMKVSTVRDGFEGQHRGYSDGSVQWIAGRSISLDAATLETTAGYRITLGGTYTVYYTY